VKCNASSDFLNFQPMTTTPAHEALTQKAQALVLAAGRGERMRPLSDVTPKPLLKVGAHSLLEHVLQQLGASGVQHAAINTAWLGEQIRTQLQHTLPIHAGTGQALEMQLSYSCEDLDFGAALETGGGIVRALPLLADPFWVVAGDVYVPSFDFPKQALTLFQASPHLAHLWLVPNPAHHPRGDFWIDAERAARLEDADPSNPSPSFTFSTIALYKHSFFSSPYCDIEVGNPLGIKAALAPWLKAAMCDQLVGATLLTQPWTDVGTPERLAQLNESLCNPQG
jgi:MurNAc alpha-1-phosphate uridylyltransferase